MPISDKALQNPKNRFIAVSGTATVGQAIAALQAEGGQPWWHLLVRMDDGSWRVARFANLHASLESIPNAADVRLAGWKDLKVATAIERESMETSTAQALARKNPGGILVVTTNGLPVGILVEGVSRSAVSISSAKLGDLGGKYIDLKDYGSILLSSSKKAAKRAKSNPTAGSSS